MKLAFCLFHYFPFGGLQRDFLRIAKTAVAAGHEVHVYTMDWQGERDATLPVHLVSVRAFTNHGRAMAFSKAVQKMLKKSSYDRVVGFNKMPGLDYYYAADVCYQARIRETRPWWVRLTPRYRAWQRLEKAVFDAKSNTDILCIAPQQQTAYQTYYHTQTSRFHLLPPGIARDREPPSNVQMIRDQVRTAYSIAKNDYVMLLLASSFKTKGLDRAIHSLAALPIALRSRVHLWVIGQDKPQAYQQQALQLGVHSRLRFFGGRHDVPRFLFASDVLIHPAYHENTGTVLLEALVAGLPVITVAACGYAPYIEKSGAGVVLPEPFDQNAWNETLEKTLLSLNDSTYRERALAFAKLEDIYSLPETAVNIITNKIQATSTN